MRARPLLGQWLNRSSMANGGGNAPAKVVVKCKKGNPTAGVKAVVQRAQGIESGRGGSQSRGHGAKGKLNVAERRGKCQKYITPAPVRMPVCKGHKIHDSIADIETRNPQRQPRRAPGQVRSMS